MTLTNCTILLLQRLDLDIPYSYSTHTNACFDLVHANNHDFRDLYDHNAFPATADN